ncbi:hypothetical protein T440DRAFT_124438 [Plenodomus tracheiphilus IPT5]|uniref:Uncharacterized protein n=1 Tax=Plenodomus tracheiphilus IPT5 TaxID=1408161 RepID=A0A6A7B4U7_9PLEO|nr:hypothetical protein T440DRAFT_124438 [Plenodomus tracheiphilus IPT5]
MAALAKNNAFGLHSPSWNLAFPNGNLTAIEILTYCPHWLKSVDVIDRFMTNGGKSKTIAATINEFRAQPKGAIFQANSAQIMMSYAMRRAGYDQWTVGTHGQWPRAVNRVEGDLSVTDFRPPRLTHPKRIMQSQRKTRELAHNEEATPIAFKDLALHVKKHPAGADALDLSRCVQYALKHPDEEWLFPDDFARLTIHLGGTARVTHAHLDRQAFARREAALTSTNCSPTVTHASRRKNMPTPRITRAIEDAVARSHSGTPTLTPRKRKADDEGLGNGAGDNQRRSSRLLGRAINFREESDVEAADEDLLESPYSNSYVTPAKERKLARIPPIPASPSNDSDFVDEDSEPDEEIPEAEVASDEDVASLEPKLRRAAAHKARLGMQSAFVGGSPHASILNRTKFKTALPSKISDSQPAYMSTIVRPEVLEVVKAYAFRRPVWLAPPILSANRLKIDNFSLQLYAAEGCTNEAEMWITALSCYRFRGPRRHAPFRELHRLTEPDPKDTSDWAENIRWAKEQHRAFGSETWTEYDYHLEMITEHRRGTMWVSEETVRAGM